MIKIIKEKKNKKPKKPYYILKYNYMIGDADGDTSKKVQISLDNPFIERYVTLINKLEPLTGTWGIVFDSCEFENFYNEGQLTKNDYEFLKGMMFGVESEFEVKPEDNDFSCEFYEGVRGDAEYSFLVFEGVELFYYDEFGEKHKTEIISIEEDRERKLERITN